MKLLAVSLLAGCATASPAPAPATVTAGLACPEGTRLMGEPPPRGFRLWCVDASLRRHGPYVAWDENGRRRVRGAYVGDQRHGRWITWYPDGSRAAVTDYAGGHIDGVDARWQPDGTLLYRRQVRADRNHGEAVVHRDGAPEHLYFEDGRLLRSHVPGAPGAPVGAVMPPRGPIY